MRGSRESMTLVLFVIQDTKIKEKKAYTCKDRCVCLPNGYKIHSYRSNLELEKKE